MGRPIIFKPIIKTILPFLLLLVSIGGYAQKATTKPFSSNVGFLPSAIGFVNDFDNLLTRKEEDSLRKEVIRFKKKTGMQIGIATVKAEWVDTAILVYATALGNKWGVGQKGKNNGILIVVCSSQRKVAIALGFGTQKIFSDAAAQKIVDEEMIPTFRQALFYQGIKKGLLACIKACQPVSK